MISPFAFITEEWLDLQTWATQIRHLPRTEEGFRERYGDFDDEDDAVATKSALASAADIADVFGSASAVKAQVAENGSYLTESTAPEMIYGNLIWWALQVENVATTIRHQMQGVEQLLDGQGATADDVRAVLSGEAGLEGSTRKAAEETSVLAAKIADLKKGRCPRSRYSRAPRC